MIGPSQLRATASIKGYSCVKSNPPEEVTQYFFVVWFINGGPSSRSISVHFHPTHPLFFSWTVNIQILFFSINVKYHFITNRSSLWLPCIWCQRVLYFYANVLNIFYWINKKDWKQVHSTYTFLLSEYRKSMVTSSDSV